jgi:hypothetical protein
MSHPIVFSYQPQTNTMDISDPAIYAMIRDAIDTYKLPVQRRATKADFAAAQTDFDCRVKPESVPGHREQVEYGAKKRIKP